MHIPIFPDAAEVKAFDLVREHGYAAAVAGVERAFEMLVERDEERAEHWMNIWSHIVELGDPETW